MNYNKEYLDIKFTLMNAFLIDADKNILDVSYDVTTNIIKIQIVLKEGSQLDNTVVNKLNDSLSNWQIVFSNIFVSKEKFNANKGEWNPVSYSWLENVLFSKSEVL